MAVTNLHEAALVLQGAHKAIAALLAEVEPVQRAAHRTFDTSDRSDESLERIYRETGYTEFFHWAQDLIVLLGAIEDVENEEANGRTAA